MTDGFFFDPIKKPVCNVYSMGIFLAEASTYDLEKIKAFFDAWTEFDRVEILGIDSEDDTYCLQIDVVGFSPVETLAYVGHVLNELNRLAFEQRLDSKET